MFTKRLTTHITCWILFITYELTLLYFSLGKLEKPYVYLIYYLIHITFFYLVIRVLNFTFSHGGAKPIQGIIRYLLLFLIYTYIKGAVDYLLADKTAGTFVEIIHKDSLSARNIFRTIYFTVLATFYWSAENLAQFRRKVLEAETKQLIINQQKAALVAQLATIKSAYLQQQINPHMLFNALNFVYARVQEHSEDAAHCVWLLAEIMHFSLRESGQDGKINLFDEIEQIRHLAEINTYRYPVELDLTITGEFEIFRIIPLILLTLTENIFKHGDLTIATDPAILKIETDLQGKLVFYSRNLKKAKNDQYRAKLGLENVRIRLNATYPGNYSIVIQEPGDYFEIILTIQL